MVKRCCIKNCRISNNSSVSLFSVPTKDNNLYIKWSNAVAVAGMILKKTHYICERHFKRSDVIDEKIIKDSTGKVLFQRYLQRKKLVTGAIPCFVNNQFVPQDNFQMGGTKGEATENEENEDCSPRNVTQEVEVEKFDSNDFEYIDPENSIDTGSERDQSGKLNTDNHVEERISTISTHDKNNSPERSSSQPKDGNDVNSGAESQTNERLFRNLFHGPVSLQLPNLTWSSSIQSSPDKIIFQEAGKILKPGEAPWFKKLIVLNDDLEMEVYILNRYFTKWENLCTLQDIQDAINRVGSFEICVGGPSSSTYGNVTPKCAYKDCSNHWRHNLCKLNINKGEICYRCANLDHTLRQHFYRRKRLSRPHMPVSPQNGIEISEIALYQQVKIVEQQIKHAKARANKLHEEIASLEKGSFDNY